MEVELQYQWAKKSKKYKTKYLSALGELFGDIKAKDGGGSPQIAKFNGVGAIYSNQEPASEGSD